MSLIVWALSLNAALAQPALSCEEVRDRWDAGETEIALVEQVDRWRGRVYVRRCLDETQAAMQVDRLGREGRGPKVRLRVLRLDPAQHGDPEELVDAPEPVAAPHTENPGGSRPTPLQ